MVVGKASAWVLCLVEPTVLLLAGQRVEKLVCAERNIYYNNVKNVKLLVESLTIGYRQFGCFEG